MNLATASTLIERRNITNRRGWIHALGIGQIISWGTLYYSFPLIAESMSQELHLSKSLVYGAATVALLASACFAYPIGKWIDQGRGRSVMAGGSLIGGLLLAAWSQTSEVAPFIAIAFLLGLAQSMTLYEAAFATISTQSGDHLSNSMTKLTLWGGFASTIFVPVSEVLISNFGWRSALLALGLFNVGAAGLYYKTLSPNAYKHLASRMSHLEKLNGRHQSISITLKSKVFWALLITFALYSLVFSGLSFHIYPLFTERELSTSSIAIGMMLMGPAQVLGRLIMWKWTNQDMNITGSGRYVLFAFPISLVAIIFLKPLWGLIAFMMIYGMANGIVTILRGNVVPEMLSRNYYGEINSYLTVPATIFKALGPFVLACVAQRFGSYDLALTGIFFLTILILLGYWYAWHQRLI